jgi:hypothetical protein
MLLPLAKPIRTQYVTSKPSTVLLLVLESSESTVAGSQRPREVVMHNATVKIMVL